MDSTGKQPNVEALLANLGWVRGLAYGLVRDDAEADDLTQEAALIALRRPGDTGTPSRPWLATVLRNIIHQRFKGESSRRWRERAAAREAVVPSASELNERMEHQRVLATAITELDEPYRSTVILRYLEGKTAVEIAGMSGIPPATVRSRLKRALDMLREKLDQSHEGGRSVWMPVLVSLARPLDPGEAGLVGGSLATSGGVAVMNKLIIASLLVGLTLAIWWVSDLGSPRTEITEPAQPAVTSTRPDSTASAAVSLEELPPVSPRVEVDGARAASESAGLEEPGWWLTGQLTVGQRLPAASVPVEVTAVYHVGPDGSLSAATELDGRLRVDLSSLFRERGRLVTALEVTARHEGFMPVWKTLLVDRAGRQDPYLPGGRSAFTWKADLSPVLATVRGRLKRESAVCELPLTVALLSSSGVEEVLLDRTITEADGSFEVHSPRTGDHRLVVWLPEPLHPVRGHPRPRVHELAIDGGGLVQLEDVEIDTGVVASGRVRTSGGVSIAGAGITLHPNREAEPLPWAKLLRTASGYERRSPRATSDDDGDFEVSGLAPGEYSLYTPVLPLEIEYPIGRDTPDIKLPRLTAPCHGLDLVLEGPVVRFSVTGDGLPRRGCWFRTGSGLEYATWNRRPGSADGKGRELFVRIDGDEQLLDISFGAPGFEEKRFTCRVSELLARPDVSIELRPDPSVGHLISSLSRDEARRVEMAKLTLRQSSGERRDMGWRREEMGIRDGATIQFRDIPSGTYEARFEVIDVETREGARALAPEEFTLKIAPGQELTRVMSLQPAAKLVIRAGSKEVHQLYRLELRDARGKHVAALVLQDPSLDSGASDHDRGSVVRTLAPGRYSVTATGRHQVFGAEPTYEYTVDLRGGETYELELPTP